MIFLTNLGVYEPTKPAKTNLGSLGKSLGTGKEDNVKFISAKAISIEKYNYNTNIYQFQLETPYELKEGQHIKFIGIFIHYRFLLSSLDSKFCRRLWPTNHEILYPYKSNSPIKCIRIYHQTL